MAVRALQSLKLCKLQIGVDFHYKYFASFLRTL